MLSAPKRKDKFVYPLVSIALVSSMAFGTAGIVGLASAVETVIDVPVCDTAPSSLTVAAPANNSVFDTTDVTVRGTLYRLSQVRVYLDGNYTSTTPVDAGATDYTLQVYLHQGTNIVKLLGVDPCYPSGPELTMTLIYAPGATPTPQPKPSTTVRGVVVDTADYLQNELDKASQTREAQTFTAALYNGLVMLDIAPANVTMDVVNRMMIRVGLVLTGTALVIFAHPIFLLYHWVRYQILKWNIHALPALVRHHTAFVLRVTGLLLLVLAFFVLV